MSDLSTFVIFLLCTVFSVKTYNFCKKQWAFHKCLNKFPGNRWLPIFGTSYRFIGVKREDSWETLKNLYTEFGPTFRFWFDWVKPVIFLSKVEHIEVILKDNVNINKAVDYELFRPWLGQGLFTAHGRIWKKNRNLLTPAFHFKILDRYCEIFSGKANELSEIFETHLGDYIDVLPYVTNCALDTIAETAMGVKFNYLKNPNSEYLNAILKLCESVARRDENPFYLNDFLFSFTTLGRETKKSVEIVRKTNMSIILKRRTQYQAEKYNQKIISEEGLKQKLAFLDILLDQQEQNGYTDEYLCDEVSTFMFAGQDTSAVTVTYILLALASYPDIQVKLHEELDSILDRNKKFVTYNDVVKMNYLDRIIKEALRKFSIAPMVGRLLDEKITLDGVEILPGVTVYLGLWQLHHDPINWPDPQKFDPDRFLPENFAEKNPYAYAPFSAGPRNCIGQKFGTRNVKIMIATLLRKFKVTCLEKPESIKEYFEVVLKPQNGLHVKFELRDCTPY